jgi:sensor histidine kinase YesM
MRRISTAQWFLVPVICILLILLAAGISFYIRSQTNNPAVVPRTIAENASYWLLWAIISPLILLLALRFPFERARILRSLFIHVLASIVCAVLIQLLHLLVLFILNEITAWQLEQLQGQPLSWIGSILPGMLVYWIILIINLIFFYYERYQNELLTASKLHAQLSDARLQALKMQLHPHFLFNTLHSITALVLSNENRDAVKMINRLSEFLRLTLDNIETQVVTLKDEVEFARRYLEIELIRFGDRLTVEMDIDPRALDGGVPNLILQPLLENAMRHAVDSNLGRSRIEISARLHDGRLLLEVRDDGKDSGKISGHIGSTGLGLKNTRERLSELYGEDYSFGLSRAENRWTVAQIVIPFSPISEQPKGGPPG